MNNIKTQSRIALLYLFIAAFLGIVLRLFPVTNIDATYRYVVHTHSHIALLGWVYIALTTIIYYIGIEIKEQKKHNLIFWCTQITILGMLFSFPFIGYALYSIIFSTLFMVCSYWFYAFFRKYHHFKIDSISYKFFNTSLLLMVVSTIGPWALGVIMNTLGTTSPWYKNAIYLYLHFQYNGWFIFCLMGIFYYLLEKANVTFSKKIANRFYNLLLISCFMTLFLSFLWAKPPLFIHILGASGGFLQLVAVVFFYKQIKELKKRLKTILKSTLYSFLKISFTFFVIKITLQALTGIPYFSDLTSNILDFVIGYLHLTFLGVVTLSTLIFLNYFELIKLPKFWTILYIIGFVLSEILIFLKGFSIWQQIYLIDNYFNTLIIFSLLMPVGFFGILYQSIFHSTQKESL